MTKVAINGLGRIGRAVLKIVLNTPRLELIALNDLVPPDDLIPTLYNNALFLNLDPSGLCVFARDLSSKY